MRNYLTAIVLLFASVVLLGCEARPVVPAGTKCIVQFRRDALGAAANIPVPPDTDNINGAQVSLTGTLKSMSSDWIVVTQGDTEYWITRDAVLMLKIQPTMPPH
jgi:hypothetical protein